MSYLLSELWCSKSLRRSVSWPIATMLFEDDTVIAVLTIRLFLSLCDCNALIQQDLKNYPGVSPGTLVCFSSWGKIYLKSPSDSN